MLRATTIPGDLPDLHWRRTCLRRRQGAERARCVRDVLVRREVTRGSERSPLRGAADVAVVESSDLGNFNDATARGCLDDSRNRSILTEREVRPRRVIVAQITSQASAEMRFVENDDVVEQFAADGAGQAFGEWVLPGERGVVSTSAMPIPLTRSRNSHP